jgi:PAS domain S-box-containing protein
VIAIRGQQLPGRRGFVTTYTDVTEQRRFEASLKRSEERYALATSAAVEGIYEWDVAAGTLFLTERAKEFFAADESMTPETWRARVHPDDWAGYHAAIVDHLKGRAPTLEHEYRIAAAGGAYRWVIDRGIGVRGVDGRVAKVVGALSDVTQRKEAEIELEARTRELTRSLDELKALGEVGRAVSSTLDLETVLSTIVSRATQLAGMDGGAIFEYDEAREEFWLHATHQMPEELVAALGAGPVRKGEGAIGRLAVTGMPVQIEDIVDRVDYRSDVREILLRSGRRSLLAVPLLREDRLLGGLIVTRKRAAEFAPQVVELLQAFATQSALAIHNARLFHEIERKRRELEAASRHKSEFLANMSHELRTPLNAIIGFSEVLAEGMFGEVNAKQAEYLGDILESGRHLLSLINDVLDLSKIEAGRMELEPSALDLPDTIENALTLVRERAMRRGIALVREVDPDVGTLHADARKVKQVLLNLLSNAIKFTPEGGRVEVRARIQGGEVEVRVADSGVGIAPEDQAAVFEEFRQVGAADKKTEGTGLGLAISRKFIELHGGRIWVTSEAGNGATFAFTLPLPAGSK